MTSMADRTFIDTNVLVYAFDRGDPIKRVTSPGTAGNRY